MKIGKGAGQDKLREFYRRKLRRLCGALLGLMVMVSIAAHAGSAENSDAVSLVILHTNDMHAHLLPSKGGKGGYANVAAYIKSVKNSREDVIALDAGDMTVGTPVSTLYYGVPIFEVMNECGYDAAVLGNHEFDNGTDWIAKFRETANFPLLSCNMMQKRVLLADAPTAILKVNGIKVGLIGITTTQAVDTSELEVLPGHQAVQRYIDELEPQVDLIVALSHLGLGADQEMAWKVHGLDFIVGGHSHTLMTKMELRGETRIVQAGCYGTQVGRLELTFDPETEEVLSANWQTVPVPVPGLAPDPAADAVIQRWEAKVSAAMDLQIGHAGRYLPIEEVRERMQGIWKEAYHADFSHQNNGGTRAPLPEGPIHVRQIYEIMPFENTIVILHLTRDQVQEVIDGTRFTEEKERYRLVTNSYNAKELIEKYQLSGEQIEDTGVNWREPVLNYVRKHGEL